ncbi:MAG: hypothetical protein AAF633_24000, partial [Chloroflexota bacterium]
LLQVESMTPDVVWLEASSLIEDKGDYRILPWGLTIFEQNGAAQVGVDSVFGYNTLELAALTDMTGAASDPRSQIYDVLSVGYVIANVSLNEYLEGDDPFVLAYRGEATRIYRRPQTLPLARLVSSYEVIPEKGAALQRLQSEAFDPATAVILEREPACRDQLSGGELNGTVEIVEKEGGRWLMHVSSAQPAMLVLSEVAFPGWTVRINAEPVEWQTAYTGLRTVCVPSGDHSVEWVFRPRSFWLGGGISLFGLLLVGLMIFWGSKSRA